MPVTYRIDPTKRIIHTACVGIEANLAGIPVSAKVQSGKLALKLEPKSVTVVSVEQ